MSEASQAEISSSNSETEQGEGKFEYLFRRFTKQCV